MNFRVSKSISFGVFINIIAVALMHSVNIIKAPVMTAILATEDYGILAIFYTWSGVIGIIAGLGVSGSLTNFRVKSTKEKYHNYCWNILWLGIGSHIILLLLFWIARGMLGNLLGLYEILMPLLVLNAMFSFCTSFMSTYFIIENEAISNLMLSLTTVVGSFVLSLVFVFMCSERNNMFFPFIEGNILVNFVVSVASIWFFYLKGRGKLSVEYMKYGLHIGIPLVFHSLSGIVLGSSDRVMLQYMADFSVAGIYSYTYNFVGVLSSIWSAINGIWAPFMFRYLKEENLEALFTKKRNFDFIFIMLASVFLLVCPEVFRLLSNERYWGQMCIVPIIVVALFANHMYSFPTNYEAFKEKTKHIAVGSIGAAVINIILNMCLIPAFYEVGAAVATAISYMALYFFHIFIAKKVIGCYPFRKAIKKLYFVTIIMSVCSYYMLFDNCWLRWIMALLVGTILLNDCIKRRAIL